MDEEYIDVLDENGNLTGKKELRNEVHKKGLWHGGVHVWIYNSKSEILLQLRAKNVVFHPSEWDLSAAGHIEAGDTPIVSAIREVKEELGLEIKEEDLEFYKIKKRKEVKNKLIKNKLINKEIIYAYLLKYNGKIEELKLQEEEVEEIKFVGTDFLEKDLKKNPGKYTPHGGYWNEIIEVVRKTDG